MPQKSPKGTIRPPVLTGQEMCRHTNRVPVTLVLSGELVAWLCTDCDAQLPAEWAPTPIGTSSVLAGAAGYRVDEAVALVLAGYAPTVARDVASSDHAAGHAASACPLRIEVTSMRDPSPQYVHGACSTTPAS